MAQRIRHTGELNQRVTILVAEHAQDEYHAPTVTETDLVTRWARIQAETAQERLRSGRIDARQAFVVTLRSESALTGIDLQATRLRWENAPGGTPRTFAVTSSAPSEDGRFIELICVEG